MSYSETGNSVASSDFNGDGTDDLFISSPFARSGSGVVYGIYGSDTLPETIRLAEESTDIEIHGVHEDGGFGYQIAAGEISGDSPSDLIITAPYAPPSRPEAGEVYLLYGNSGYPRHHVIDLSLAPPDAIIVGGAEGDHLGWAASAADLNGDGIEDIALGAPHADPDGRGDAGKTYVIYGGWIE
jgi:hypothetical protein